ncbi:hypothetical protein ASPACDRAFT_45068 [Aspergillus aculeatus ATCC 16872]|uniref:Uncharacterized protein n=1 Tax=Aspergillus aculeatus (strain ATCC 16872 / CBS 172.66 / WB 5094) TaxID=690307 RepID=A0A1L9WQU8_ASPA1|nr:uncharacterized protein ASPACDRAFT_45068 [Aspergillus aculeatus ATCC 16872]OJJ98555.1 hypothetical protein ASPACDRAFT_45068 [Aspergillus aculeatus ATCC 16872]
MSEVHTFPNNDTVSDSDTMSDNETNADNNIMSDDSLSLLNDETAEPPDSWRLGIIWSPDDADWDAARLQANEWWRLRRQAQPHLRRMYMGGVVLRGGHARFLFGDTEGGQPARYIECNGQLDFDFALREDLAKYQRAVDMMISILRGADDSWKFHREELLALPSQRSSLA